MSGLTEGMDAIFRWYFSPLFGGCPCKLQGKGCINYRFQETPPYYICQFTHEPAYVPRADDDSGVVAGMYG